MATFFIADLHFGHKNILGFDNRPWINVENHDAALIKNWNETVGYEDTVYILGDISWHNATKTIEIFKGLNGKKFLIIGNHDKRLLKSPEVRALFMEIAHYAEIECENRQVVLSHYPIPCFNGHFYNGVHLYGHVHNSFEWNIMEHVKQEMRDLYNEPCRMFNVGAMMGYMNYTPRTLSEILEACENGEKQI